MESNHRPWGYEGLIGPGHSLSLHTFSIKIRIPIDSSSFALLGMNQRLKKIVSTVSDISVGRAGYSMSDFVEDVKRNCAREDVMFDNDLFNELVG